MNRQWSANPRLVGRKLATRAARSACVETPEQRHVARQVFGRMLGVLTGHVVRESMKGSCPSVRIAGSALATQSWSIRMLFAPC